MNTGTKDESKTQMEPEDIVREYIGAKDGHDWDKLEELLDPNYMSYDPSFSDPVRGIEPIRQFLEMLDGVDMKTEILSMMSKGDTVAAELEVTCIVKRKGEFAGHTILPSDRPLKVRFAKFYKVNSKGLLAEEREYSDTAAKMKALGVES